MKSVCFNLYHDGEKWIAKNEEMIISGRTLRELDEKIRSKLKDSYKKEKVVKVMMELDYRKNIPQWIWQYHPYYFYRTVYMELD